MHTRVFSLLLLLASHAHAASPGGSLSLSDALALSLRQNPELKSYDWDIRAAEARTLQAGLKPNPVLNYSAQNLPGSGPYRGGDIMENTLELGQLVELGGKRLARVNEANAGRSVAEWAYQVRRVEVLKNTTQAFVAVLAAQRQVQLAEVTAALAEKVTPMTQKRVEAGKANAVEVMRSKVAVASAKIELEQAKRTLATARINLAVQWGAQTADFDSVKGDLEGIKAVPKFSTLVQRIQSNPEIARWSAERDRRYAALAKQRSLAKPDITVSAGPRMLGKGDDISFVVGFSIPLPFKNKNQGGIAEAEAEIAKTDSERKTSEMNVYAQLSAAYQVLLRATTEVELLNKDVLPGAKEAEEAVMQGYEAGRFTQLEILDARRTLIQARNQHLRALTDYHQAQAEIAALTAAPISLQRSNAAK
jgi:cobalt-zinc-cadmium efflux system outer membrane protein